MNKTLQSLVSLKKIFAYGNRVQPARDWFALLSVAFVLLVLSIGWNIFLFIQFQNEKSASPQAAVTTQEGVGASVTQVQTIFQQRATEEQNYQKNYYFVDPSQPGA